MTDEKAEANAAANRKLWRAGVKSNARLAKLGRTDADAIKHGRKAETFADEAQKLRTNIDTAKKMRRLAGEYTAGQIDALCDLVVKHGSSFSGTHMLILLRVENRKQRNTLAKQAIRESWSTSRLERAIQAAKGERRPNVGRKPKVPDDPVECLITLQALCAKFNAWCAAVLGRLPEKVQLPVNEATEAVEKVRAAVAGHLPKAGGRGPGEALDVQNHFLD